MTSAISRIEPATPAWQLSVAPMMDGMESYLQTMLCGLSCAGRVQTHC
ncbi:MAG TPA: hypothetical protein VFE77_17835 [Rhodanobacter sp.]|nr:hypothetical protein [Rhodanobacter sp.]